jgi:hypothetical protein
MQNALFLNCAGPGCQNEFAASARGKQFCSAACRAKASDEAQFKRRLAHKQPMQTAERRALRMAAAWLGERE